MQIFSDFFVSLWKKTLMNYGYIRVSSDRQTVENQRFEITRFCELKGLKVEGWIEETVSGTKAYGKRRLGALLRRVQPGDLIVCSELSRLGRSLYMIMEILSYCMRREVRVWTIKDGYRLGDDIQSKVLAFAFGLSAEIERNLISQRTREALADRKAAGVVLGRPKGSTVKKAVIESHLDAILKLRSEGISLGEIAYRFKVHRNTLHNYLKKINKF